MFTDKKRVVKCLLATRERRWEKRNSKALSHLWILLKTPLHEPLFQNVRSIVILPRELNPQPISFQTFQSERAFTSHKGEMSVSPFPPEEDGRPVEGVDKEK